MGQFWSGILHEGTAKDFALCPKSQAQRERVDSELQPTLPGSTRCIAVTATKRTALLPAPRDPDMPGKISLTSLPMGFVELCEPIPGSHQKAKRHTRAAPLGCGLHRTRSSPKVWKEFLPSPSRLSVDMSWATLPTRGFTLVKKPRMEQGDKTRSRTATLAAPTASTKLREQIGSMRILQESRVCKPPRQSYPRRRLGTPSPVPARSSQTLAAEEVCTD